MQDFERDFTIKRWPKQGPGQAAFSTDWSADGKRSLRLDPGVMGSFRELAVSDWTGYGILRFTVHNPGPRTAGLGVEIQDDHDGFDDRHQHSFGAPPGDHVIELDFSGGLWRGEENRPYRGSVKGPIDTTRITRLAFANHGERSIYVDHLELARAQPLTTPGGFAFDFGCAGKQVMAQTTGVLDTTRYTPERGYGFLGQTVTIPHPMSYPTPLLGDGVSLGKEGFRVDLPGGAYQGWIAFERGGFFEDEQSGYKHADLLVNGTRVAGHAFHRAGAHFLFEDLEITDLAEIEDKIVRPAHAITRFRFQAQPGANVFTLAVDSANHNPLRVAGLILAPDTPEGTAFLDAHEKRQHDAIAASYPPEDRGRRHDRAPPARDLVAEPLPLGAQLYPRDWPEHPEGAPPRPVLAVTGKVAAVQLALHATHDLAVHAEVSALTGPNGATLAPPLVSQGRYLPMRPLGNGPVWLEINHYRPDPDFRVAPDLARAVLLEWRLPRDAAPGVYKGSAVFTAAGIHLEVPLEVRVHALDLPPIPIPVGLFMSALPFGPEAVGEQRWWQLQEALLDEQARAGLNATTGGPGLTIQTRRDSGTLQLVGDNALRYLALARAAGEDRAVVAYGGFLHPLMAGWVDEEAFGKAFLAWTEDHHLPPFYLDSYDEPGTRDELDLAMSRTAPFTRAGLFTMGFSTRRKDDSRQAALLDATYAPALDEHDPADIQDLRRRGRHPWIYNNGLDRFAMGLFLWRNARAGVEGRLEWIGLITQGFAFDNLDGREPGNVSWLVHRRLGLMPAPRWLSAREGLLDYRIRLALEKAVPAGDPALSAWPAEGYASDRATWTDAALEDARARMLERLARSP